MFNRIILSLALGLGVSCVIAQDAQLSAKPFFDVAAEFVANYASIVAETKKKGGSVDNLTYLAQELEKAKIAVAIAQVDLKTLQEAPTSLLASQGQIMVDASRFGGSEAERGDIVRIGFGAENAFGFVLLHAAGNKSAQDVANTLAMLKVLCEKNLNPYAFVGHAFFDKEGRDYVSMIKPTVLNMAENMSQSPIVGGQQIYQLLKAYAEQPQFATPENRAAYEESREENMQDIPSCI